MSSGILRLEADWVTSQPKGCGSRHDSQAPVRRGRNEDSESSKDLDGWRAQRWLACPTWGQLCWYQGVFRDIYVLPFKIARNLSDKKKTPAGIFSLQPPICAIMGTILWFLTVFWVIISISGVCFFTDNNRYPGLSWSVLIHLNLDLFS